MKKKTQTIAILGALAALLLAPAAANAAAELEIKTQWGPTTLQPGSPALLRIYFRNLGDQPAAVLANGLKVTVQLPPGVTWLRHTALDSLHLGSRGGEGDFNGIDGEPWNCPGVSGASTVTCTATVRDIAPMDSAGTPPGGGVSAGHLNLRLKVSSGAPIGLGENVVTASVPGAISGTAVDQIPIGTEPAGFGLVPGSVSAGTGLFDGHYMHGNPVHQAGAHPYEMRVNFDTNMRAEAGESYGSGVGAIPYDPAHPLPGVSTPLVIEPDDNLRTLDATLPRGVIGNPEAVPKCSDADFLKDGKLELQSTGCPSDTEVGYLDIQFYGSGGRGIPWPPAFFGLNFYIDRIPIYNLDPPKGTPVDFGFNIGGFYHGHIYAALDAAHDYRIKAVSPFISSLLQPSIVQTTFWGVPGDPSHDRDRSCPATGSCNTNLENLANYEGHFGNTPIRPLLTLPMACGDEAGPFELSADSWQHPGAFTEPQDSEPLEVEGCEDPRIRFEPKIRLQPTSRAAGGPTGLDVHLEVPQRDDQVESAEELYAQNGDVQAIPTPPMKKVVVTLPDGMTLSTSAAQGLGNCSAAEIGLGTDDPVRCPESSRYGSLTLHTPILPADEPMHGDIYIAKQNENPFHNFLSMYFVIHDEARGLLVKVPGRLDLDPRTGQITTTFDDLPQFPISDMQLTFKSGVRAGLVNPPTCGTKTITATFYSWSEPQTPVTVDSNYDVTEKPDGSPCVKSLAERPFGPEMEAGTVSNSAGSYSPFVFRLQRTDDDQEFSQLSTTLPPGLLANISQLSECPEAGIRQAEDPRRTGTAEKLFPSCPASSQIGTTDVGSGVGQVITYIPGKAYLAGPYRGAPLSMVVITPILAGPYDLGVIAVRSTIHVNGELGQATVSTDPFPQIDQGIPVRLRDIRVKVDRPRTTINPTSCDPMAVTAHVTGTGGNLESTADDTAVDLSDRFQAADCASLPFKPDLRFRLKGGTKRGDFPAFSALLRGREGDANIARSTVVLPRSEFIEQGHIRTVCTRVQFNANQCPPGSVYGVARAKSPLFAETLEGPVYLRSNGGERVLPDLVVRLNGKIDVTLAGFIDSVGKGRVRNTFDVVPDAPVTFFSLKMKGGKGGLLVNHRDLCTAPSRAAVELTGQNGKTHDTHPKVAVDCKEHTGKHKRGASR
jgi:hypothetical protein